MLDSTSRGIPACRQTFSSVHPSRPAAQLTTFRAAWASKLNIPNDFPSLSELEDLLAFQRRYEQMAKPFQRAFTRTDLVALLAKLKAKELRRVA